MLRTRYLRILALASGRPTIGSAPGGLNRTAGTAPIPSGRRGWPSRGNSAQSRYGMYLASSWQRSVACSVRAIPSPAVDGQRVGRRISRVRMAPPGCCPVDSRAGQPMAVKPTIAGCKQVTNYSYANRIVDPTGQSCVRRKQQP